MIRERIRLGTVIYGTMLEEDLIPAFLNALERLDHERAASYWDEIPEEALDNPEHEWWQSDEAFWMLEELFDVLNEYTPPFVYFGANEGNGSDYGFWIDWYSLQKAIADGEVLYVDDLSEVPEDYDGLVLNENGHGNYVLYEYNGQNFKEYWSVV